MKERPPAFSQTAVTPRRSVLYMPGANTRAMEKAREIDCDGIVFDLEDAVAPAAKEAARDNIRSAVRAGGYGHRELVVRVNGPGTPWWEDDVRFVAGLKVDAVLVPKVESTTDIDWLVDALDTAGGSELAIWVMLETARAIQRVDLLAAHPRASVLVMGTADLVTQLRGRHDAARRSVDYALQRCLLAARAADKVILDSVHLDFRNLESLRAECEHGRDMGFDGKTLIHPGQVDMANAVFGPSPAEVDLAQRIADAWASARDAGRGVAEVDGRLIEHMHVTQAERTLAFARALAGRGE